MNDPRDVVSNPQSEIQDPQSPFVIFTAAHAGFSPQIPLGGGATIARWLNDEWSRTSPGPFGQSFDFITLGPGDAKWPSYHRVPIDDQFHNLTGLSEHPYARFCYEFERATTEFILREAECRPVVVLSNDISEGPDFDALAARGIPVVTIFHVDVVDYFCKFYLRGVKPERMTRWYEKLRRRGLHRTVPRLLRLVFEKQRAAVMNSRHLIVPSSPMKDIILRCYPQIPADRVEVVPWGGKDEPVDPADVAIEKQKLRTEFHISPWHFVVVTLGRLSPEKGIDRLLDAYGVFQSLTQQLEFKDKVEGRERRPCGNIAWTGLNTLVCGDPAYMRGDRYLRRLQAQVRRLTSRRIDFLGHISGARKQAVLELASLLVHPSRHESFGLTLVEAMRAGVPVLTTNHYSAHELITPDCGIVVDGDGPPRETAFKLMQGISTMLLDSERRRAMGQRARERAGTMRFEDAAARIAALCG